MEIGNFFSLKTFGIYRSFGAKKRYFGLKFQRTSNHLRKISKKYFSKLKNKKDVLKIDLIIS